MAIFLSQIVGPEAAIEVKVEKIFEVNGYVPEMPLWTGKACISTHELDVADLFAAFAGARTDGHKYIDTAFEKGASIVLCSLGTAFRLTKGRLPWRGELIEMDAREVLDKGKQYLIEVDDVERTLQDLAAAKRKLFKGKVVGITGSFGKTTMKELLSALLPTNSVTKGNYNNLLGVPLTVLEASMSDPVWIVEMGMNHRGELTRLGAIAQPTLVVFTPIGTAHIGEVVGPNSELSEEELRDVIAEVKTELLRLGLPIECVWYPSVSPEYTEYFEEDLNCLSYDAQGCGKLRLIEQRSEFPKGIELECEGVRGLVSTDLLDSSFVSMIFAAISCASSVDANILGSNIDLQVGDKLPGRREARQVLGGWWIHDAYNASPETMAALAQWALSLKNQGKCVTAVLGDILELGEFAEELHNQVWKNWMNSGADLLVAENSPWMLQAARANGYARGEWSVERFAKLFGQGSCNITSLGDWDTSHEPGQNVVLFKASNGVGLGAQLQRYDLWNDSQKAGAG